MADNVVMRATNVSKKFCRSLKHMMFYGAQDIARNTVGLSSRSDRLRDGEFWAVDDVSFELKRGETLGIIGPNGSGKSTMLKMLNGIFMPDRGKIEINGRVGALIEVGAGFHPMLSGRENIYINGSILGMSKKEIDEKYDEIVEFADIGDFIDSPVKHYSSGMFVRLGVAVAVNINPEILLIDEVLSVGDLSFQNKSMRRLAEIRGKAHAVIFVSHNLEHVQNLCDKVLVINKGIPIFLGSTEEAILRYHETSREIRLKSAIKERRPTESVGGYSTGEIELLDHGVLDNKGNKTDKIKMGDDLVLFFDVKAHHNIERPVFSVSIRDERNNNCIWQRSNENNRMISIEELEEGRSYKLIVKFTAPPFMPGVYRPLLGLFTEKTMERFEKLVNIQPFIIEGDITPRGIVDCRSNWEIK